MAYADVVALNQVKPIVDLDLQEKVRLGLIKKVPHAFLEGELTYFHGRLREKAPEQLLNSLSSYHSQSQSVLTNQALLQKAEQGQLIGYNPRVAKCFYAHQSNHQAISERFIQAKQLIAIGWAFFGHQATWTPMVRQNWCQPEDLQKTSSFEKQAMVLGKNKTATLLQKKNI